MRHPLRATFSALGMALLLAAPAIIPAPAQAENFSFTGTFTQDDNVQFITFTADGTSTVTIIGYAYAGGTNAAGTVIPRGGFDSILALFDGAGNLITQNDDGSPNVGTDAITGASFDSYLSAVLTAGNYTIAVAEFDNFAIGPTLADGFPRVGNFTTGFSCPDAQPAFNDVTGVAGGCGRTGAWAFDVLNVDQAAAVVPEPASLTLLGAALLSLGLARRRR